MEPTRLASGLVVDCTGCGKPGDLDSMVVEVMRADPGLAHGAWHSVLCRGAFLRTARHSMLLGPVEEDGGRVEVVT